MSEEKQETIKQLKKRAKEMLHNNYKRKIGDEEIYTIICEWGNALNLIDKLQKENDKLKYEHLEADGLIEALQEKIDKLEEENEELKWQHKNKCKFDNETFSETIKRDYVSKNKIRDKIKELEVQEDWYIENKNLDELYGMIDILQELLEEE